MKITSPFFLLAALLLPTICLSSVAEEAKGGERQIDKIVFLGNSITKHGPSPQIGWTGNWGMAASAEEKDYAHLVVQGLRGKNATPPEAKYINIAAFERGYENYNAAEQLKEAIEFAPEVLVIAIGENVPALKTEQAQASFKSGLLKLLTAFKKKDSPAIVIRSSFWANKVKDGILKQVALEVGGIYVDISSLGKDEANYARSERDYEHAGVAAHPGDKGMAAIANAILERLKGWTFYVSNDGDDAADGLSPTTAWKTLMRANKAATTPGDSVLFRRGDEFRGQLQPHSGTKGLPVTYGAYGEGRKPVLLGSVARNRADQWTDEGNHIWSADSVTPERDGLPAGLYNEVTSDVGNIIFNNGAAPCGFKRWKASDLKQPGNYWYDREANRVKLVCEKNPTETYDDIEFALRQHIIARNHANHIVIEDLALLYGAAHGIGGYGYHHMIVRRLDVGFIGGGDQHGGPYEKAGGRYVRFGNGIEFWGTAHDCLVEGCRIWECYDAALTPQGNNNKNFQNITYRNNTIWNCEFSFEYWNRPETAETIDVAFINNRCYNTGGGWGHRQRPDKGGRQLCFYGRPASHKNFRIENNLFYGATNNAFFAHMTTEEEAAKCYIMNNNQWYQPEGAMMFFRDKKYTMAQFEEYKKAFNAKGSTLAPADLEVPPYPTNLRPAKKKQ